MTFRTSPRSRAGLTVLLAALAAAPAFAQARRPTPHEAIERNLGPMSTALRELSLTDAERAQVADVVDRAEAWAAEMVEAEHHRDQGAVQARARRMERLALVLRARVDAMRAEAQAAERERAVVASAERRTQARAALERAAEQRLALERSGAVSTYDLPPPDLDASPASTDASTRGADAQPSAVAR